MGIKDLFKTLHEANLFDTTGNELSDNPVVFVDFNSYFYAAMYHIKYEEDLETFPSIVESRLRSFMGKRTVLFIDKGKIEPKEQERDSRRKKEAREIDLKILENRSRYEDEIFDLLNCNTIIDQFVTSDHHDLAEGIKEMREPLILYVNNFDAEYSMVLIGSMMKDTDIIYASNDQDTVALSIINTPKAFMLYNATFIKDNARTLYRIKQDTSSIMYAQLITYVTMLSNKSDYFPGIEYITAKTFLSKNVIPYTFDIKGQSISESILDDNQQLLRDIIRSIKLESSKPQYFMNGDFTDYFVNYVIRVSKFLSLDMSFFLK